MSTHESVTFSHTQIYHFFHLVNQLKYLPMYILTYQYFYFKIFSLLQLYYGMQHEKYNVSFSIFIFKCSFFFLKKILGESVPISIKYHPFSKIQLVQFHFHCAIIK